MSIPVMHIILQPQPQPWQSYISYLLLQAQFELIRRLPPLGLEGGIARLTLSLVPALLEALLV